MLLITFSSMILARTSKSMAGTAELGHYNLKGIPNMGTFGRFGKVAPPSGNVLALSSSRWSGSVSRTRRRRSGGSTPACLQATDLLICGADVFRELGLGHASLLSQLADAVMGLHDGKLAAKMAESEAQWIDGHDRMGNPDSVPLTREALIALRHPCISERRRSRSIVGGEREGRTIHPGG